MGSFTFEVTQELIDLIPEIKEHNYEIGSILVVSGMTYSPNVVVGDALAKSTLDDGPGGSDPTKPHGKLP